jgi:Uncharacterized protein conserved in bacteria (DUF2155)
MRPVHHAPAVLLALALMAMPAAAQIITVPLDPIEPGEVLPGEILPIQPLPGDLLAPGQFFPDDGDGTLFNDDGTPLEPVAPRAPGSVVGEDVMTVEEDVVAVGTGAALKGLDKLAGTVEDITLASGETAGFGWLQVTLGECRYPVENPSGEAYAWLVIREKAGEAPIFEGWMIASSPALNALDHARFDVWVINCTTE